MSSLKISLILKMWFKVNIMVLINCKNWKSTIKKSAPFSYYFLFIKWKFWKTSKFTSINKYVIARTNTLLPKIVSVVQNIELNLKLLLWTYSCRIFCCRHLSVFSWSLIIGNLQWLEYLQTIWIVYFYWNNQPKNIQCYYWHHLLASKNGCSQIQDYLKQFSKTNWSKTSNSISLRWF